MTWLLCLFIEEVYHVSCLISIFAEFLCGEIRSVDGEDVVLIQAIMSIKSIVQLEPPSYEKVLFLFHIKASPVVLSFLFLLN